MGRPTTIPTPWLLLTNAYGGVGPFCDAAGIGMNTLYRITRYGVSPTPRVREKIEDLAIAKKIKSPLPPDPTAPRPHKSGELVDVDWQILEWLGVMLRGDDELEIPEDFLRRYAKKLGDKKLIEIADSDSYSLNAHRAVAKLLGL